ncbi:MAG: alpha/beta hydrolase [Rhodospirillales bacterium]|nr:alpha/beta hydrolase [Alphaproteobacteria bacterium]USO04409.1 MAG: alpha/beta hydrolase [Rhodospirillales bacterium]
MRKPIEISTGTEDDHISALLSPPTEIRPDQTDLPLVVMAHHFPGTKESHDDLFGDLEFLFNTSGLPSLRFDFRGCGQSSGRQEHFTLARAREDFDLVLHWAKKKGYKNIILVGEGLGARLALEKTGDNTMMLLLFWPLIDLPDYAKRHFDTENLFKTDGSADFIMIDRNKIGMHMIGEMLDSPPFVFPKLEIPVLIQHGAQDTVVPVEQLDLLKGMEARRLDITTYQDGGHGLPDPRHRKMIFFHIGQFLEKYT